MKYSELPLVKQRVVDESAELAKRIERLGAFIDSPQFGSLDATDQALLRRQMSAMMLYYRALDDRLTYWHYEPEGAS